MGMPTNVRVDETLLAEAVRRGGGKSRRATVNDAQAEFVRKRQAEDFIALFGTIDYEPGFDHRELRGRGRSKPSNRIKLKKVDKAVTERSTGSASKRGVGPVSRRPLSW